MEAQEYLKKFPMFGSPDGYNPGQERVEEILKKLGSPHRDIPAIHIAGTNGKGSTAMILSSILKEAGICVGLYTSPEMVTFRDRIRIQGEPISIEDLEEEVKIIVPVLQEIEDTMGLGVPTFFEVVTALAFHYFSRKEVDLLVLETGLGGRLDATNVCSSLMSIITNVSLEHTKILGDTLEEITWEKAGIIKKGHIVLNAAQEKEVVGELMRRCDEMEATLYLLNRDFSVEPVSSSLDGQIFHFQGLSRDLKNIHLSLLGRHQMENGALSIGVSLLLHEKTHFTISEKAIYRGLSRVVWSGRLEVISQHPTILIDGAHNPGGIRALVEFLKKGIPYNHLYLLLGILKDKDADLIFRDLLPLATRVILSQSESSRAADPYQLATIAEKYSSNIIIEPDFTKALRLSLQLLKEEDLLCISGSLYTMSLARSRLPHLLKETGHISSSTT